MWLWSCFMETTRKQCRRKDNYVFLTRYSLVTSGHNCRTWCHNSEEKQQQQQNLFSDNKERKVCCCFSQRGLCSIQHSRSANMFCNLQFARITYVDRSQAEQVFISQVWPCRDKMQSTLQFLPFFLFTRETYKTGF